MLHDQDALDAVAAREGVVSWRWMRLHEHLTHDQAVHRLQRDATRVHRGAYVQSDLELTPRRRALAAVASAGPDAVPSHRLAAALLGLWQDLGPPPATVTRPRRRRGSRDLDVRVAAAPELAELRALPAGSPLLIQGRERARWKPVRASPSPHLLTTSALRTVRDLAVDDERLVAVCAGETAVRLSLATLQEIRSAHPLLAACDPRSDSPLETWARLVLLEAGLVPDALQHPVLNPSTGFDVLVDIAFLGRGGTPLLAIEADGRGPHELPQALFRDRRKQVLLEEAGFVVRRVTWQDLARDRQGFVRGVLRVLRSRAT